APGADAIVIVCGCHRACVNRPEIREKATRSLVLAGDSIAGRPSAGESWLAALREELVRLLGAT
ncbi:MAG: hypothetical protein ABID87_04385, partial [Chloroflexota bacterium]